MKYINPNLLSIKCVLFLFFGGISCLFPFLMNDLTIRGFTSEESWIISIVTACIALIGPAIAGPLADKMAGGYGGNKRSKSGMYLRVMIAVCMMLAAIFYSLLMAVPTVQKKTLPKVSFMCDQNEGFVIQEGCGSEKTCYNWNNKDTGSLKVKHCRFTCESALTIPSELTTLIPEEDITSTSSEYDGKEYNNYWIVEVDDGQNEEIVITDQAQHTVPNPHLCYSNGNEDMCEVFTMYSNPIDLNINLNPSEERINDTDSLCRYKIGRNFHCRINEDVIQNFTKTDPMCHTVVMCDVHKPYNSSDSILVVSECGYNNISFWVYLLIRSIADMFPAAAVALLDAAVIIATRETSTGRGDAGKQFAAGALGLAIFAPIVGSVGKQIISVVALTMFAVQMLLGALITLLDFKMPLSPPEWWWHTRCGLLALPMSTVRKYSMEIGGLTIVLILLGIFWSAVDVYLPWRIAALSGDPLIVGLSVTVGALPAVIYLIYAEKLVDYCGHTNLLITAFVLYIIQYTAITFVLNPWLLLIGEALEIFTLHMMWITAVLYLRHLVPRKFTVSGQALPVIAHFCIGRMLGALLGGYAYSENSEQFITVYKWMAVGAAIIAAFYFFAYHFYLKPKCAAPTQHPPRPTPSLIQSMNGNGSYTPLRVYHNGRAKKGQFRY